MGQFDTLFANAWRKWVVANLPSSGAHNPRKEDIIPIGAALDTALNAIATQITDSFPVAALAGTNQALSGLPLIDGHQLVDGEVLLCVGQTDATANGPYTVHAGAWARPAGMDTGAEFVNAAHFVQSGTVHGGETWKCISPAPITLGATPITYTLIRKLDQYDIAPTVDVTLGPAGVNEPIMRQQSGLAWRLGNGRVFADSENIVNTPDWQMEIDRTATGTPPLMIMKSASGKAVVLSHPPVDPMTVTAGGGTTGPLFTTAQYDEAQAAANIERARKCGQDLSALLRMTAGVRACPHGGQSKDAQSDMARLFMTLARRDLLGLHANAVTVSPDGRCVNTGATFITFNANERKFYDLRSNMIFGTDVDRIATQAEYDRGDYPLNARGEWCGVVRAFVRRYLQCQWLGIPYARDQTLMEVAGSWSKTDGLASEVFAGDGLARSKSFIDVVVSALTAPTHDTPGFVFPVSTARGVETVPIKHGEADNNAAGGEGTPTYILTREAWYADYQAKLNASFSQTAPFAVLERQVGGPYATVKNVAADQQIQMGNDITGNSKWVFLVSQDGECPNGKNVPAPHPNAGDQHQWLVGAVILGVRDAIAEHYIIDRNEPHFIPEPLATAYYADNRFLIPIVSKYGGLHEAPMPYGVTPTIYPHWGFSFKNGSGALNPVTSIKVVPGSQYTLIEGTCQEPLSGYTFGQTGRNDGSSYFGLVNVRDGFRPDIPFKLPFDKNQTQYGNAAWADGPPDGNGYRDDPKTNGFGRYIEDIPGWVGDYDWGNPLAFKNFTMVPLD